MRISPHLQGLGNRPLALGLRLRAMRWWTLLLLVIAPGCCDTRATVDLRAFHQMGVSLQSYDERDESLEYFGRIKVAQRTYIFGDRDAAMDGALRKLKTQAEQMGANRVIGTRFRGRWRYLMEPWCRRNLSYLFLIVPAFLPIPTSATLYGRAVYDPSCQLAK
jgi:hypothetical protein